MHFYKASLLASVCAFECELSVCLSNSASLFLCEFDFFFSTGMCSKKKGRVLLQSNAIPAVQTSSLLYDSTLLSCLLQALKHVCRRFSAASRRVKVCHCSCVSKCSHPCMLICEKKVPQASNTDWSADKKVITHVICKWMCILEVTPTVCQSIWVSSLVAADCINLTLLPPQQLPLVNVAVQQLRMSGGVQYPHLTACVLAEGDVG